MKVLRINQDGTMDDINISSIKKNVVKNLNRKMPIKKGSHSDLKDYINGLLKIKKSSATVGMMENLVLKISTI